MISDWPATADGGDLGDDRPATATDRPATIDELASCVASRAAEGFALYPQGGRTALDYGGTPRRPGVALDLTALDRVIDYPAGDMTITVEAGITLEALRATLAGAGQRLPLDAPRPSRATLGGIYATATAGPRRLGYGQPRDLILGVRFVNAEGTVIKGGGRVVKNVAGYDFPKLLTGSMGTLGVLAEMTLKVRPIPEASALVWAEAPDGGDDGASAVAVALDRLNTSATRPVALELLNREAARMVGSPVGLLPSADWVLVLGFEDNADAVAWQTGAIGGELPGFDLRILDGIAAQPLWSRLVDHPAAHPGPVSVVANLRPSGVVPFVAGLDPALWAVQSHAGNGIVHAHRLIESDLGSLAPELDRLRAGAVAQGGNLVVARCPAAWKPALKVWGEPRGDWPLMERIKAALDPGAVLNPGRFVGTI